MNKRIDEKLKSCGLSASSIMLPGPGVDYEKWAVVACDQYTSERDYWKKAEECASGSPSTLNLIYPECYLEDEDKEERIARINETMRKYVKDGVFKTYPDCLILVERTTESGTRYGLMASLDLEEYSYDKDSVSLIRATEGTILSRIPPRKEIRKNADLEIPHIMVLISDGKRTVIEPLRDKKEKLKKVYDTDLMLSGGHVKGYLVDSDEDLEGVADAFIELKKKLDPKNPLLFAMGDGNHSLATAKSCWEDIKKGLSEEEKKSHPARYALVELENIFDEALFFEPIHRVFFGLTTDKFDELLKPYAEKIEKTQVKCVNCLSKAINEKDGKQHFGVITDRGYVDYALSGAKASIAAGTIQSVIDEMNRDKIATVDYIHGKDVTDRLGKEDGNIGLLLPEVSKETFFSSIIRDKAFPRKTFSIGHANEKRYYMEAKSIR